MKRCKQCNTEYDGRDNCPNCGSVEYWEVDVWGQPQEPQQTQTPPVNLKKEEPQSPPPPPPYQPPAPEPQQNFNQQQNTGQPQPPQPPYGQPEPPYAPDSGAKGMTVGALVLGILSLILFWAPFVGLGMGIVALCLDVSAKKRLPAGEQGMATAGIVLGIIGIILGAIASVITIVACAAISTAIWSYADPYNWYW